jgi:hypothetical protein
MQAGFSYSDIIKMEWSRIVLWHQKAVERNQAEIAAIDGARSKAEQDAKRAAESRARTTNPDLVPV